MKIASKIWNFTVQCCILSGVALALPDNSDVAEKFRWWAIPLFWIHHIILTIIPWIALKEQVFDVEVEHFGWFWYPFAFFAWNLYFFDIQQGISLFFNTLGRHWGTPDDAVCNINYMIYPPPVAGLLFIHYFVKAISAKINNIVFCILLIIE